MVAKKQPNEESVTNFFVALTTAVVPASPPCKLRICSVLRLTTSNFSKFGTADIFPGFMVSLYVKGKENGHVQAYAPTGAVGLKRWGGLTSKLDGYPITSEPHLWWQACP
ncbi:MAG: hypothetical protein SO098_04755 [Prevotella sp.]|nr:hypothetical protein [Prevotella sp.]